MKNGIIHRKSSTSPVNIDGISDSQFWSIEGRNVQFTCFDVPANRSFRAHKHPSEQITYVIEGELFFRSADQVYKLMTGDCIFIPGNIEHEVWTEKEPAKAVDAWSPVNKTFSNKSSIKKV
jgi:quercetin dioxygenase-like cupin family protein